MMNLNEFQLFVSIFQRASMNLAERSWINIKLAEMQAEIEAAAYKAAVAEKPEQPGQPVPIEELSQEEIEKQILHYEQAFEMRSEEFLQRMRDGKMGDSFETNDWGILLRNR